MIVAEKVVYHLTGGDYTVSNRIRYYPYKVTYIDLYDYMMVPHGSALPVHTDIVRAQNAEDAKGMFRLKNGAPTLAFISAGRYPERLGTSVIGSQTVTLTKHQLKAVEQEVKSGAAKLPHSINPSVFVTKNPNSTIYTRPARPTPTIKTYTRPTTSSGHALPVAPIGARPSVSKSTPIQLSSASLDVGGFSVGFRKPGDPAPATPPPARPTPQPDIYNLANTAVPGGALANPAATDLSSIAMPSGFNLSVTAYEKSSAATGVAPALEPTPNYTKFVTKDGVTHDAIAVPHVDNIVPKAVVTPVVVDEPEGVIGTEDVPASPSTVTASTDAPPRPNPFFYADRSEPLPRVTVPPSSTSSTKRPNWFFGLLGLGLVGIIHLVKPTKRD